MNQKVIQEFRENQGKVGGFFENMDLLLLHTAGARSGKVRVNPVVCINDGERYVIAASKGGADNHPDWYYNLRANPDIMVEVGSKKFPALVEIAQEPERSRLFDKLKNTFPGFAEYEKNTKRVIPIVIINPRI